MADKHPKSLRNAKVGVAVLPKDRSVDETTADKIARSLRKDIKKALKDNEDKPSDEQVGKAMGKATERKEELQKEGKDVDIGVAVTGERGDDGEAEGYVKATGEAAKELAEDADLLDQEDEEKDSN